MTLKDYNSFKADLTGKVKSPMVFLYKPEIKTNATKFDFNIQSPVYGKAENIYTCIWEAEARFLLMWRRQISSFNEIH